MVYINKDFVFPSPNQKTNTAVPSKHLLKFGATCSSIASTLGVRTHS